MSKVTPFYIFSDQSDYLITEETVAIGLFFFLGTQTCLTQLLVFGRSSIVFYGPHCFCFQWVSPPLSLFSCNPKSKRVPVTVEILQFLFSFSPNSTKPNIAYNTTTIILKHTQRGETLSLSSPSPSSSSIPSNWSQTYSLNSFR